MTWTKDDDKRAEAEGWAIFESFGSDNGPYQVCTFDEPDEWEAEHGRPYPWPKVNNEAQDHKAWEFVQERLADGSEFHERLINHLREINPQEAEAILAWERS